VKLRIPSSLAANCLTDPERAAWLDRLPGMLRRLEHLWALTPDAPLDGEEPSCSYVTAVRAANGTGAVLKIAMPHMDGEQLSYEIATVIPIEQSEVLQISLELNTNVSGTGLSLAQLRNRATIGAMTILRRSREPSLHRTSLAIGQAT
jgi:hypothetical protein